MTVEVWVAPLDAAPPALALLSDSERARAARYRDPRAARRFSAARGWLRHVLGAELGISPAAVPLADGPGKPRLVGEGPCFNLSRSGELALIAVAPMEVGVDVEQEDQGRRALEAATLACTPVEAAALQKLELVERASAFLRIWTAKEAYLKAIGEGLAVPPDRIEIGIGPASGLLPVQPVGTPGPPRWYIHHLRPAPGYVGAVAAPGRDWDVRLRSTIED